MCRVDDQLLDTPRNSIKLVNKHVLTTFLSVKPLAGGGEMVQQEQEQETLWTIYTVATGNSLSARY